MSYNKWWYDDSEKLKNYNTSGYKLSKYVSPSVDNEYQFYHGFAAGRPRMIYDNANEPASEYIQRRSSKIGAWEQLRRRERETHEDRFTGPRDYRRNMWYRTYSNAKATKPFIPYTKRERDSHDDRSRFDYRQDQRDKTQMEILERKERYNQDTRALMTEREEHQKTTIANLERQNELLREKQSHYAAINEMFQNRQRQDGERRPTVVNTSNVSRPEQTRRRVQVNELREVGSSQPENVGAMEVIDDAAGTQGTSSGRGIPTIKMNGVEFEFVDHRKSKPKEVETKYKQPFEPPTMNPLGPWQSTLDDYGRDNARRKEYLANMSEPIRQMRNAELAREKLAREKAETKMVIEPLPELTEDEERRLRYALKRRGIQKLNEGANSEPGNVYKTMTDVQKHVDTWISREKQARTEGRSLFTLEDINRTIREGYARQIRKNSKKRSKKLWAVRDDLPSISSGVPDNSVDADTIKNSREKRQQESLSKLDSENKMNVSPENIPEAVIDLTKSDEVIDLTKSGEVIDLTKSGDVIDKYPEEKLEEVDSNEPVKLDESDSPEKVDEPRIKKMERKDHDFQNYEEWIRGDRSHSEKWTRSDWNYYADDLKEREQRENYQIREGGTVKYNVPREDFPRKIARRTKAQHENELRQLREGAQLRRAERERQEEERRAERARQEEYRAERARQEVQSQTKTERVTTVKRAKSERKGNKVSGIPRESVIQHWERKAPEYVEKSYKKYHAKWASMTPEQRKIEGDKAKRNLDRFKKILMTRIGKK